MKAMKSKYKVMMLVLAVLIVSTGTVALAKGWFNKPNVVTEQFDAAVEWQKLMNRYSQLQQAGGLNMEGNIILFDGKEPGKIKEQNTTLLQCQGKQYYYTMAGVKYLCDGEILLQVDPINQFVILSKVPEMPKLNQQILPQINQQPDQNQEGFRITGTVEGDDKKRKISIKTEMNPDVKNYSVVYDPSTYNITDVEIEWWKNNLSESKADEANTWITKIKYQHHPSVTLNMEEEMKKVIAVIDGKITLIGDAKDYKLEVIN